MKNALLATRIVSVCCLLGALGAFVTTADIASFLVTLPAPPNLAAPIPTGKLAVFVVLYVLLGGVLGLSAWNATRASSAQRRIVSGWSPLAVLLWALVCGYLLLVYYPLPPHPHHLDKLLFILGAVLLWGLWFTFRPLTVACALNSRVYEWIKLGAINILIFVVAGELVARLVDPVLAGNGLFGATYTPASLTPHKPVEGSIRRSNSHGFRDRERTMEKPASTLRILALGDSFTWGVLVSYDEIFTTLLEHSLQPRFPEAEVINLGVPGFAPEHELDLLKVFGIQLHPDVVMLNLFVGNDIMLRRGSEREARIIVAGHIYYKHLNGNWLHDRWGPDRWYLYHNLNRLIRVDLGPVRRFLRGQTGRTANTGTAGGPSLPGGLHLDYVKWIQERYDLFLKTDTSVFGYHWRHTEDTLETLHEYLRSRGVPLLLVVIPDQAQLDHTLQEDFLGVMGAARDEFDFDKPQRMLMDWCVRRNVACLDLLPVFKKDYAAGSLYFQGDTHWTALGHARAASSILPTVEGLLADMARPHQRSGLACPSRSAHNQTSHEPRTSSHPLCFLADCGPALCIPSHRLG